jgi:L-ascorbate metabolism protein UlaG (beta-lactamase superfamily)
LGGPTVLIEYDGLRILTDPTFDPPGQYQGPHSAVRHVKTTGPALSAEHVGKLDAILLSHDHHFDNLDKSGRALLPTASVTYTTNSGAERLGGNAIGVSPFETRTLEGPAGKKLLLTATPARHGPLGVEAGDVIGFALGVECPVDLMYITGDTLWFEGTAEVAHRFSPKIVVLFTGAAEPRGRFHMTMGSEDAWKLPRPSRVRCSSRCTTKVGLICERARISWPTVRQVQLGRSSDPVRSERNTL